MWTSMWNIHTSYQCDKMKELIHELERYWWDNVGLAEFRWPGFGEAANWYSGEETKQQHGICLLEHREVVGTTINCISFRLISTWILSYCHHCHIVTTDVYENSKAEEFYYQMEKVMKAELRKDIEVIPGVWAEMVGKFVKDKTSNRGSQSR